MGVSFLLFPLLSSYSFFFFLLLSSPFFFFLLLSSSFFFFLLPSSNLLVLTFKQSCCRISSVIRAHLVHLVQKNHWIVATALSHCLKNPARKCANIGSTMSANHRLVANSTERNAMKFSARGKNENQKKKKKITFFFF